MEIGVSRCDTAGIGKAISLGENNHGLENRVHGDQANRIDENSKKIYMCSDAERMDILKEKRSSSTEQLPEEKKKKKKKSKPDRVDAFDVPTFTEPANGNSRLAETVIAALPDNCTLTENMLRQTPIETGTRIATPTMSSVRQKSADGSRCAMKDTPPSTARTGK